MVTSNTYRQSSRRSEPGENIDPQNKLLWRMNIRRLEGEALRDAMLAVSGQLNLKMGGPSVRPKLPKAVTGGWKATKDRKERNRRSVYVFLKRNLRYPLFGVFDAPDSNLSCARRNVSTNAPQALTLLNGDFSLQSAQAFAGRILQETDGKAESVIRQAYRLALGRAPDEREMSLAKHFLNERTKLIHGRSAKETALPVNTPAGVDRDFAAAVVEYCHVVMNLNEFIYVD